MAATPQRRHAVFHPLTVAAVDRLTDDAVAITLAVPDDLAADYRFSAGQHVTVRCTLAGDEVRRNYSICSSAPAGALRIGVKHLAGGVFSTYAAEKLQPGDVLEVMTPSGSFTAPFEPSRSRHYGAIAAGSGITPILSLLATALETEPDSRATLIYANRTSQSVMFLDELSDLKDTYLERLCVLHVLSRERQEAEALSGRLDPGRFARLLDEVVAGPVDDWFLCGPLALTDDVRAVLLERGAEPADIHRELFFVNAPPPAPAGAAARAVPGGSGVSPLIDGACEVTVVLDGRPSTFSLSASGATILDATLAVRPDAPYACKNGMCGTCRAKVTDGEAVMDRNYALEDEEIAAGFVLACQAHPTSPRLSLDFDA